MNLPQAQVWFHRESGDVEEIEVPGGTVVAFSQKNPLSTGVNEDAAGLFRCCEASLVLAVADGMGGGNCGDRAAQAVIQSIQTHCLKEERADRLRSAIVDAIEETNQEILRWGIGAGATVVVTLYWQGVVRVFHIGDAEALLCSNRGRVKMSTVSHGPTAMAVELGVMDELTAMTHDDRNLITNFVGSKELRIEIGPSIEMGANDTLLLASDGLFDNLTSLEVIELIRKRKTKNRAKKLRDAVRSRMQGSDSLQPAKSDDLTVMMFCLNSLTRKAATC